jgi:hypothetical protein
LTFGLKTGNHHNLLDNSISVYTAHINGRFKQAASVLIRRRGVYGWTGENIISPQFNDRDRDEWQNLPRRLKNAKALATRRRLGLLI